MAGNNNGAPQVNPIMQNQAARQLVINNSIERLQQISSQTVVPASQPVVNINPRNVGLLKGFFIDVVATVSNTAAGATNLSPFGPANILSQIKFDDLQNNTRIQTTGWHLHFINSMRNQRPFGLCETLDTSPIAYGNNHNIISAPATIAADAGATIRMQYYVPLAYSNDDLRGAVYANVVNATMQLQLTINAGALASNANAASQRYSAVYLGATGAETGTVNSVTITVYQHYLDQIPMGPNGPVLPMLDLSTIYELKNTAVTGISENQDYTIPYANFRTFLSTLLVYDAQDGSAVTVPVDNAINYWALRSANFTDVFKLTPQELALMSRISLGLDYPNGVYYMNHRNRPINTIQYGNIEAVLNASSAEPVSRVLVGYEDFAQINVVSGAGSLPAGG